MQSVRLPALIFIFTFLLISPAFGQHQPKAHFVGSKSCRACHAAEYDGWQQTRMANVVRDPREHPEAA